jgi:hypothetical protein
MINRRRQLLEEVQEKRGRAPNEGKTAEVEEDLEAHGM